MRWGPGPVFIYECLVAARRWQTYALRSAGVAVLLFAMAVIAAKPREAVWNYSWREYAEIGQVYFAAMIGVELALVILAAPAATAGAICVDRARGTLAHMLMTDLSDAEIVLGKLAARLLPVLGLVACTWPVMAISSLLGGIDPIALTLAIVIIVTVAVLGCSTALAISVWARKSHEVILATYAVFILGLLLWPICQFLSLTGWTALFGDWALLANPFYVAIVPIYDASKLVLWDYLVFFTVALAASGLLTVLAVWRTRPVACRGSVEQVRGQRLGAIARLTRWLHGPSLDRNPVLWREWHRSRPSLWMSALVVLLMGTSGALCIVGAVSFWINGVDPMATSLWQDAGVFAYFLHVIFGLLILAALAPTSMAEERQRGSLDVLATTTLSTREIVTGKWLGTFRLVLPLAIAPGLMALAMATARAGTIRVFPVSTPPDFTRRLTFGARIYGATIVIATILAHGALITSIGVALAVWIKRQSRAIATSIGLFILIAAAWPIIISNIGTGLNPSRHLASLSPIVMLGVFVNVFMFRSHAFAGGELWCGTFWTLEVSVLAIGLWWLSVRTFDGCSGRIPSRPHRFSVLSTVVMVLAGMLGAGSVLVGTDWWLEGFEPLPEPPGFLMLLDIMTYSFVVAIGLALIAIEAATSRCSRSWVAGNQVQGLTARRLVLSQWWESFRLVLLLVIGPAFVGLSLTTARMAPHYEPIRTTNAAGVRVITGFVLAKSNIPYVGEVRVGQRMMVFAVLIITILAHGAAAVSLGQGLASSRRARPLIKGRYRRNLVGAVSLILLIIVVPPAALLPFGFRHVPGSVMWSLVVALDSLLTILVGRTSFEVRETLWSVMFWDILVTVFALGLSWWTIQTWRRRLSGVSGAHNGDIPIAAGRSRGWGTFWIDCSLVAARSEARK